MFHLDRLCEIVNSHQFRYDNEKQLQDILADEFARGGLECGREVEVGPGSVVDFLTSKGLAIEVKVDVVSAAVLRQVHRYCESPRVVELAIVTRRRPTFEFPDTLAGKPVYVLQLPQPLA